MAYTKTLRQMSRKNRRLLLMLLAVLLPSANSCSAASPPASHHIHYTVAFAAQDKMPCLDMMLTFMGDSSGSTRLALPSGVGPSSVAYPNIVNVQAVSPGTSLVGTNQPSVKQVTYLPGQAVSVRYCVLVTHAGQQFEQSYSLDLQPGHFCALGMQIFAIPAWGKSAPLTVDIAWNTLPQGWTIADSYGVRQTRQTFQATPDTLPRSVWAAGDYRVLRTLIHGKPFYLAVRGKWPAPDQQMLATFSRILSAERGFWHDNGASYYLVVLNAQEDVMAGMALTNSFYETAPPGDGLSFIVKRIFAHEAFHAWLPYQMEVVGRPHAYDWFNEGFTDYYATRLLLRSGLITPAESVDDCNRIIRDYYSSPFRNISEAQYRHGVASGFSDYRGYQIVYERGYLLAQHWNTLIRTASHGQHTLDDAMHALLALTQKQGRFLPPSALVSVIRHYARQDVSGDIMRYCEQGATLAPDPAAFAPYALLTPTRITLFDLGYNINGSIRGGKITGVEPGSNAYRAGLRDGQTYVDADFAYKNPAKPAHITIKDQAFQRVVTYYPAGQAVLIPQYKIKRDTRLD